MISHTIILWYFDFSWVRYPRIGDSSGERRLPSSLEQSIDLRGSTGSVMDLGFHGSYFRCSFDDVIAKIANVRRLISRFPSLSAFAASDFGLFFGQLLLFDLVEVFLLFRHWLIERGAFPSRAGSSSSWMSVSILLGIVADVSGIQVDVLDLINLQALCGRWRTLRVPFLGRGCFARVLARRSFLRCSRPAEWGCEVDSFPANLRGSARTDCSSLCR